MYQLAFRNLPFLPLAEKHRKTMPLHSTLKVHRRSYTIEQKLSMLKQVKDCGDIKYVAQVNAVNLCLLKWQAVEDRLRACAKKNTRRKLGKPGRRPTYPEQEQQLLVKVKDACQQGWSFTWKHCQYG